MVLDVLTIEIESHLLHNRDCNPIKGSNNIEEVNRNMRAFSKSTVIALAAIMTSGTVLAACSKSTESPGSTSTPSNSPGATAAVATTYPIKTDTVLTHWYVAGGAQLAVTPDASNWPIFQELAKRTGIKEKYITPAVNQQKEQLNVMFASGEYADIIEWNWLNDYPGGPEKAIKDGNILKLNDLIDKFAPNLKKYLKRTLRLTNRSRQIMVLIMRSLLFAGMSG
jgi:putative aldouronate transport system substrate-binding protein